MATKWIDPLLIEDVTRESDDPNQIFCVPPDYVFVCVLRVHGYSHSESYDCKWKYNLFPSEQIRWDKNEHVYKLRVKYPTLMDYKEALVYEGINPEDYVFFSQSYNFMDNKDNHEDWIRLKNIFDDLYTWRKEHGYYDVERSSEPLWIPEPLPTLEEILARKREIAQEKIGDSWDSGVAMLCDAISDDERWQMINEEQTIRSEADKLWSEK